MRETARKDAAGFAMSAGVHLRPYQVAPALAIKDSVINNRGYTFVVVLPRQSGKDELKSHLLAWLMLRYKDAGAYMVEVNPTFKPQTINAMERVRNSLDRNPLTRGRWKPSAGFIFRFFASRLTFLSADPSANVVGTTANVLLSVNEAQDIDPAIFDKRFDPMTASTNATRVIWGTVWTSDTLLARQMEIARQEEKRDHIKRLFIFDATDVGKIVPAYKKHVARVVAEKGRQHPLVKTQYYNEQIDAQAGMFNATRRALMQGDQLPHIMPTAGHVYAFLIDVAGQDEGLLNLDGLSNPGRDSTTLSIAEIDLTTLATLRAPTYRIVHRRNWQGTGHLTLFGQLKALADIWKPQHIAIDATGVGEGLWALMDKAFPTRVLPVKFTQQTKSEIGWRFLSIIETGRFRDCAPTDTVRVQYDKCISEILPGPAKTLRWGVPDGSRDRSGQLVHDDHILADCLTAVLDELEWSIASPTLIAQARDPLDDMSKIK